jgi:hypothetical protein
MKIWYGYGSEHSMNLVMIGEFKTENDAERAKELIDSLTEFVSSEVDEGFMTVGDPPQRYSERMLELLKGSSVQLLLPAEFEQFAYEFSVKVRDKKVILTTDESEVSAFLKLLIEKGARVEVYSAHRYPDTEYGRGK